MNETPASVARYNDSTKKLKHNFEQRSKLSPFQDKEELPMPRAGEFLVVTASQPPAHVTQLELEKVLRESSTSLKPILQARKQMMRVNSTPRLGTDQFTNQNLTTNLKLITSSRQNSEMLTQSKFLLNPPQLKQSSSLPTLHHRSVTNLKLCELRKETASQLPHSYRVHQGAFNQPSSQSVFKPVANNIPKLVKHQRNLLTQNSNLSPFMVCQDRVLQPQKSVPLISPKPEKIFLNLEVYDPLYKIENCEDLIDKYKDPTTGVTMAYSKWHTDEIIAYRECQVLEYIPSEEMFVISWWINRKQKRVSRFNLRFALENEADFYLRLETAETLREKGQKFIKYLLLVNEEDLKRKPLLSDQTKTKISYMINSFKPYLQFIKNRVLRNPIDYLQQSATYRYNLKSVTRKDFNNLQPSQVVALIGKDMKESKFSINQLKQLFREIDDEYIQVHKKIQFDMKLPYSGDKYQDIADALPQDMFMPPSDRIIPYQLPQRLCTQFLKRLLKVQKRLLTAQSDKLRIMQLSQQHLHPITLLSFFQLKFQTPITIAQLKDSHEQQGRKLLKLYKNHAFDIEYEVQKMINSEVSRNIKVNQDAFKEMTFNKHQFVQTPISEDFIDEIWRMQKVLQMRVESSARSMFIRSVDELEQQLQKVIELVTQSVGLDLSQNQLGLQNILDLSRDAVLEARLQQRQLFQLKATLIIIDNKIVLEPSQHEWAPIISTYIQLFAQQLNDLPCFQFDDSICGPVHEDKQTHVFDSETTVSNLVTAIQLQFFTLSKIPEGLLFATTAFQDILMTDMKEFKRYHKKTYHEIGYYQALLDRQRQLLEQSERLFYEPVLFLGPFQIEVSSVKKRIARRIKEVEEVLFECIKKKIQESNMQIEKEVEDVLAVIQHQKVFRDIEHVTETQLYVKNLPEKMVQIRGLIKDAISKMTLLEKYQCSLGQDEMENTWYSISKPLQIFDSQGDCIALLESFSDQFYIDLKTTQLQLMNENKKIAQDLEVIMRFESLQMYENAVSKCDALFDKLENSLQTATVVNRREALYHQILTDYSGLQDLKNKFLPFNSLWNYAREYFYKYNLWINGPIGDLDREKMPLEINDACKGLQQLAKTELRVSASMSILIANELRDLYIQLTPYLPLIVAIKNPYLQQRHWEIINKMIKIDSDLHQSISELVQLNVLDYLEDIASVSDISTKEKQLELQLNKMRQEWAPVKFQLHEVEGTVIIQGLQPIWDMLDEQIQKTMIIAGSPYVKYLVQDVVYWKQHLLKMQEVLEEWSKAQRSWLYLYPIFNSTDIQKQLQDVASTFNSVDKMWRVIMLTTQTQPQVVEACNQFKLIENLQQCNVTMERVQKLLNQYLHEKRLLFPRFFFLSNDDLLHILSQAKEPLRVQDHLNKCFEGISKLQFQGTNAVGMCSHLGEVVPFISMVQPIVNDVARPVEDWLKDVEQQMRMSLKRQISEANTQFSNVPKEDWITMFSQQVILVIDQVQWTLNIESALKRTTSQSQAMQYVLDLEEQKLQQLVKLIATKTSSAVTQMTLNNLIVLDVHTKDITAQLMSSKKFIKASDFEWQSQMRHYLHQEDVTLQMVDSQRHYGYEYLGNQTRLVITPLTDRCYRTLMGALKLNLGGAPEGPAGTGKTETTKDLSKAVAQQCLVFNCSDQIDYQTMGKFLKGLACCGAWACFDEFNRIELEVLSVIAAQILTIQGALMRRKPSALFNFEDEVIMMNAGCAVFITMNPGYAGRSELPDNLKALFRPVAMMVPDYAMIAEISLYSFGFQNARELSIKITLSLKLSSEQLSTQSHYDYGMRAVKSIILAAGVYKSQQQDQNEHDLVLKAIQDCNQPKFIQEDQPLFEGIMHDLFPVNTQESKPDSFLMQALQDSCKSRNLVATQSFLNKALQLFATVQVRHGLMLVGQTMSGKTEVTMSLAEALKAKEHSVDIFRINPKAVTISKLYGDFEKLTRDWQDGILAKAVRNATESQGRAWVVLDGPVDAVWIENLNTVLDDNKKLCLISGEIIKLTPLMTFIFEVEDLLEASPATVSRCGMVYFSAEQLGWQCLIEPWFNDLPEHFKTNSIDNYYRDLIAFFVPQLTDFLFGKDASIEEEIRVQHLKPVIFHQKIQLVKSFLTMLKSLLSSYHQIIEEPTQEPKLRIPYYDRIEPKKLNQIFNVFIMALCWGFGAYLPVNARSLLVGFIHQSIELFKNANMPVKKRIDWGSLIPKDLFSFAYLLEETWQWLPWDYNLSQYDLKGNRIVKSVDGRQDESRLQSKLEFNNLLVVTAETMKQQFFMNCQLNLGQNVLLLGDTGTGKTRIIKKLMQTLENWETGETVLSASTTAVHVQKYFESLIEKHKKGVFGPKNPQNKLLIFVDDLNVPIKEKYGAQPPLEIIRQWADMKGCYNKHNEWYTVQSQVFIAAMQLQNNKMPSQRLLRQFHLLYLPDFENHVLQRIFTSILEWGFADHCDEWKQQIQTMVSETITLFKRTCATLLPLPGKSHYQFNLRQVSELTQGLIAVNSETVKGNKKQMLQKLWCHEALRVFSDRLVSVQDQQLFWNKCLVQSKFEPNQTIFCNFVDAQGHYQEIISMQKCKDHVQLVIDQYNAGKLQNNKISIHLFDYVIEHLARVSRILQKESLGHGILVGLGDNGRKTIAKIAAFLNDYSVYKIEPFKQYGVSEWQEDLKTVHKSLGIDNKKIVFLLTEQEIRQDHQMQDVNNLINAGEIIGLLGDEDHEEINYELDKQMKAKRMKGRPLELFMQRCKRNLHIVLVLSPAGEQLQMLFRKYPSLVNCASIDWFLNWPAEALLAVSRAHLKPHSQFLTSLNLELVHTPKQALNQSLGEIKEFSQDFNSQESPDVEAVSSDSDEESDTFGDKTLPILDKVSYVFVQMHNSITKQAELYYQEKRRRVFVTAGSFVRLFGKFMPLLQSKSQQIDSEIQKFEQGILNLAVATVTIDEMQANLEALKPVLELKSKQVEMIMARISIETKQVQLMRQQVDNETQAVESQRLEAEAIKLQCEERLQEAQPHFEKAIKALSTLTTNDFVILKSFSNPPDGVKLALEACCIMLGIQPDIIKVGNTKVNDYWQKSKKLIKDYKKLIQRLEKYEKDNVSEQTIQKILPYIHNSQFNPDLIRNASNAAEGICKWVIAIYHYDIVYKEIKPKREALAESTNRLHVVQEQLFHKQEQLAQIIEETEKLHSEYQLQLQEKQLLLNQRDESQKKLNRASILMQSIGSEKERWIATSSKLQKDRVTLLGDTILATAFVNYLGLFEGSFRTKIFQLKWCEIVDRFGLHYTVATSIRTMLADQEQIQQWLFQGLPGDPTSIENMIIMQQSNQPLVFVDPQSLAYNYFAKLLDGEECLKMSNKNAVQIIEQAIIYGKTILIYNCGDIDHPALVSICKKEVLQVNGISYLQFNDEQTQMDPGFKPYIFSEFDNPNISPLIQQAATVLNFCVTSEGLEQQLLRTICQHEQAKEEVEREKLLKQNVEYNRQRKMYMEQILEILRDRGAEILESDTFVNTLEESRKITNDLVSKLAAAKNIEDRLEENRRILKPLAVQAARLFFVTQSLAALDPMYRYSMIWFTQLFVQIFDKPADLKIDSQKRNDFKVTKEIKTVRVNFLKRKFRELLYSRLQMSIFEHHKLLLAFYIAIKLNEPGQIAETFSEKLKALDHLMSQRKSGVVTNSAARLSAIGSAKPKMTLVVHQKSGSRMTYSKGDSVSGSHENNLHAQFTIMQNQKEEQRVKIDPDLLKFVLTGYISKTTQPYSDLVNPNPQIFTDETWQQLQQLTCFEQFEQIQEDITNNLESWERFMRLQNLELLPEPYLSVLPHFAFIPLVRVLKPEMTTISIRRYIKKALGEFFITPQITYLRDVFELSNHETPMLVLLTPGNDPMDAIKKLSEEKQKIPYPVSLGKGQNQKARYHINEMRKAGGWIVLQNCHLGLSFLPELEQIIEDLKIVVNDDEPRKGYEPTHPDFRMWLTSASIDYFPLTVLQNAVKITSEPPKGIKTSLIRTYTQIVQSKPNLEFFESCKKQEIWQPLFFALSFFHAIVRERRRYQQLGWNLPSYDFNESDFRISQRQLYNLISENDTVPFDALRYLCGECNYGGRVTDEKDRRTLTTLLQDFYQPAIFDGQKHQLVQQEDAYAIVKLERARDYLEYCHQLPNADEESPYLVGLHQNANIIQSKAEAKQIFQSVLKMTDEPITKHKASQLKQITQTIQSYMRSNFKLKEVQRKFPFSYEDSMNGVLQQELQRYNTLIDVMTGSLQHLDQVMMGQTQTNPQIELLQSQINNNQVPSIWLQKSFLSRKTLIAYMEDFKMRVDAFQAWIENGVPNVFWISCFFFTHSFLAGIKQNFARKHKYPYDKVEFEFIIGSQQATDGRLVQGLFLEGANLANGELCESSLKVIHVKMPQMELLPVINKEPVGDSIYQCPTYVTGERAGTLSTTGHSTNFIMTVELPTGQMSSAHWIKRSVALLSQSD